MTWYQTITLLEILFGALFFGLYAGYLWRVRRIAHFFGQRPHGVWVKFVLRHLYLILIVIAILGPSFGAMKKEIRTIGKDLYIAVDLSASMNATDVQPSRLEKSKQEIQRLITRFNSDRMGLMIFGDDAYIQSPLTYDQNALQLYTRTLNTNLLPNTGTNYEPVLQLALEKFGQLGNSPAAEQKARVLVLISDGEDFGDQVEQLAEQLREQNIRVFTLGVGTTEGSRIPVGNTYKRDNDGNIVTTKLNPEPLAKLAELTNGQYFEVNDRVSEISRLVSAINNIEGELRESKTIDVTANKYVYPLALALLLILLDALLTIKIVRI
ncbi:VWA domain-containing protein [Pontibacter sp. BT310]|jgi:Ca-activated chloride channel homolog|uniref:VWA domain-containing protein n=1 Tax=Pontibacter populi TaxID=890055 RepID=A0ABS6X692_9BACT|nr:MULTISPECIES: VWA domain-containing protein [Pontibacter]MBJ6116657.1 VWA domain-containing protein [Pontibacter sp. BT310]MBR0569081.1 VWA domain-containing protein [Microvirga sp. STS03]MBW3363511.1 VWA domain-containing protein [Pontibacter populi]